MVKRDFGIFDDGLLCRLATLRTSSRKQYRKKE
jgi:hypothetical protein